jgi:hypothetical protein
MWLYQRRRCVLTSDEEAELNKLFAAIPNLELPYHFREDVSDLFDTAENRQEASTRLEALR